MNENVNMEEKMAEVAEQAQSLASIFGTLDMNMATSGIEPLSIVIAHMSSISRLVAAMAAAKDQNFEAAEDLIDDLVNKFLKNKLREDLAQGSLARDKFLGMIADEAAKEAIQKAKRAS